MNYQLASHGWPLSGGATFLEAGTRSIFGWLDE